jgi:hypothetical protein
MVMKVGMPVFDVSLYILRITFDDDNFFSVRPIKKCYNSYERKQQIQTALKYMCTIFHDCLGCSCVGNVSEFVEIKIFLRLVLFPPLELL